MQLLLKIIFSWQMAIVVFCLWWWLYIRMIKVKDTAKFYQQKFFEADATVKYQAEKIEAMTGARKVYEYEINTLRRMLKSETDTVIFYKTAFEDCAKNKKENI